jgi:hypothetical protein
VLFGGTSPSRDQAARDDLWEWDGREWIERHALAPNTPPRKGFSVCYDGARAETVMFGGYFGDFSPLNFLAETWAWNGQTWTQRKPAVAPQARTDAPMVYDEKRRVLVLHGGNNFNDTWEWDGAVWQKRATPTPGSAGSPLVYDRKREIVVALDAQRDVWEYDGVDWKERNVFPVPTPGSLTYDELREKVVVLGTRVWEWDGTRWTDTGAASPSMPAGGEQVFHRARRTFLHWTGGDTAAGGGTGRLLEWGRDVAQATLDLLPGPPTGRLVYDDARSRVLMVLGLSASLVWELHDGEVPDAGAQPEAPPDAQAGDSNLVGVGPRDAGPVDANLVEAGFRAEDALSESPRPDGGASDVVTTTTPDGGDAAAIAGPDAGGIPGASQVPHDGSGCSACTIGKGGRTGAAHGTLAFVIFGLVCSLMAKRSRTQRRSTRQGPRSASTVPVRFLLRPDPKLSPPPYR